MTFGRGDGRYAGGLAHAPSAARGLAGGRGEKRRGGRGRGRGERRDRRRGFAKGSRACGGVAQRLLDGGDTSPQRRYVYGGRPRSARRALGVAGDSCPW